MVLPVGLELNSLFEVLQDWESQLRVAHINFEELEP